MLKLKTEQQKTLYLRGFVGSVYEDGVWEEPADAVYGGENAGMLAGLRKIHLIRFARFQITMLIVMRKKIQTKMRSRSG